MNSNNTINNSNLSKALNKLFKFFRVLETQVKVTVNYSFAN